MNIIKLGSKVRDTITGYTGIVTARCENLHDAPSCCVTPLNLFKNNTPDPRWFSEARLRVLARPKK